MTMALSSRTQTRDRKKETWSVPRHSRVQSARAGNELRRGREPSKAPKAKNAFWGQAQPRQTPLEISSAGLLKRVCLCPAPDSANLFASASAIEQRLSTKRASGRGG
jgi:hypothetical protein